MTGEGADQEATATDDTTRVNVARIIEGHDPETAALISRNHAITYADLDQQAARLRGGLSRLGIAHGDRVAIICGNGHPFVIAYLAAVGLGAVVVPLNPTSPPAELGRELAAVGAVAVVVDRTAAAAWRGVDRARLGSVRHVVAVDGDLADGAVLLDELLAADPLPVANVEPDHIALLMFTSGTAGAPRAAMLTHGSRLVRTTSSTPPCPSTTSSGSTWCSVTASRWARRSCWSSASTRPRRSNRSGRGA
jgi:long-chain acyl-CoA synthetase